MSSMLRNPTLSTVLLCIAVNISPGAAIVQQESRADVQTMSFGHELKQHPLHKGALFWKKDDQKQDAKHKVAAKQEEVAPAQHSVQGSYLFSEPKKAALYQQHVLDIPKHTASQVHPPLSALKAQATGLTEQNFKDALNMVRLAISRKSEVMGLSPVLLIILFAACVIVLGVVIFMLKGDSGPEKSFHLFSDSESERASDTQSERTTDRELKTRMDRFEKRLSEHDALHAMHKPFSRGGTNGSEPHPDSPNGIENGPRRISWMEKR